MNTTIIGNKFEQHALNYLIKFNAKLITRQYKSKYGEIDLIVYLEQDNTIIFVEVRARNSNNYGGALYSINPAKQNKIILTAQYFMQNHPEYKLFNYRFDVIIFENGKLKWLQNVIEE